MSQVILPITATLPAIHPRHGHNDVTLHTQLREQQDLLQLRKQEYESIASSNNPKMKYKVFKARLMNARNNLIKCGSQKIKTEAEIAADKAYSALKSASREINSMTLAVKKNAESNPFVVEGGDSPFRFVYYSDGSSMRTVEYEKNGENINILKIEETDSNGVKNIIYTDGNNKVSSICKGYRENSSYDAIYNFSNNKLWTITTGGRAAENGGLYCEREFTFNRGELVRAIEGKYSDGKSFSHAKDYEYENGLLKFYKKDWEKTAQGLMNCKETYRFKNGEAHQMFGGCREVSPGILTISEKWITSELL